MDDAIWNLFLPQTVLPWKWFRILALILHVLSEIFVGFLNPFDNFGSQHTSINIFSGRIRLSDIAIPTKLLLGNIFVNEVAGGVIINVSAWKRRCSVTISSVHIDISMVDNWSCGTNITRCVPVTSNEMKNNDIGSMLRNIGKYLRQIEFNFVDATISINNKMDIKFNSRVSCSITPTSVALYGAVDSLHLSAVQDELPILAVAGMSFSVDYNNRTASLGMDDVQLAIDPKHEQYLGSTVLQLVNSWLPHVGPHQSFEILLERLTHVNEQQEHARFGRNGEELYHDTESGDSLYFFDSREDLSSSSAQGLNPSFAVHVNLQRLTVAVIKPTHSTEHVNVYQAFRFKSLELDSSKDQIVEVKLGVAEHLLESTVEITRELIINSGKWTNLFGRVDNSVSTVTTLHMLTAIWNTSGVQLTVNADQMWLPVSVEAMTAVLSYVAEPLAALSVLSKHRLAQTSLVNLQRNGGALSSTRQSVPPSMKAVTVVLPHTLAVALVWNSQVSTVTSRRLILSPERVSHHGLLCTILQPTIFTPVAARQSELCEQSQLCLSVERINVACVTLKVGHGEQDIAHRDIMFHTVSNFLTVENASVSSIRKSTGVQQTEQTVQVEQISLNLDQYQLASLGILSGILSQASSLFTPTVHFIRSPVIIASLPPSPAERATTRLYVAILQANAALWWRHEGGTESTEDDEDGRVLYQKFEVLKNRFFTYSAFSDTGCQSLSASEYVVAYRESALHLASANHELSVSTSQVRRFDPVVVVDATALTSLHAIATRPGADSSLDRIVTQPIELFAIFANDCSSSEELRRGHSVEEENTSTPFAGSVKSTGSMEDSFMVGATPRVRAPFTPAPLGGARMLLFRSKAFPIDSHFSSKSSAAMGVVLQGNYVDCRLNHVYAHIDAVFVDELCRLVGRYAQANTKGSQYCLQTLRPEGAWVAALDDNVAPFVNPHPLPIPYATSILAVHLDTLKFSLLHLRQPAYCLTMKSIDLHNTAYGPTQAQLSFVGHGLSFFDLTAKYAVHTCIIGSFTSAHREDDEEWSHPSSASRMPLKGAIKKTTQKEGEENQGTARRPSVETALGPDLSAQPSTPQYQPNRVEFHMSSRQNECSLLEAQLDNVRVFYLQRSTMTAICFFQEFLIPSFYKTIAEYSSPDAEPSLTSVPTDDSASLPCNAVPVCSPPGLVQRSLTRLTLTLTLCEIHLPLNSNGTDSIVAIITRGTVYKTCPIIDKQIAGTPGSRYSITGPFIDSKFQHWIGDIKNSRKFMHVLFHTKVPAGASASRVLDQDITPPQQQTPPPSVLSQLFGGTDNRSDSIADLPSSDSNTSSFSMLQLADESESFVMENSTHGLLPVLRSISFRLPRYAASFLVPPATVTSSGAEEFLLSLNVFNACLCSWCSSNAVTQQDLTLHGSWRMIPTTVSPFNRGPRNTMIIDISTEEVDWTLSQGQYLAIINMIQQNFCELNELVIDPYIFPPLKVVKLKEAVYGKYCLEPHPNLSTVPIHIKKGRIFTVESTKEYYELFVTPLPPAHHPYGVGNLVTSGRQHYDCACPNVVRGVEFEDTIPRYSKHFYYRDKMIAKSKQQQADAGAGGFMDADGGPTSGNPLQHRHNRRSRPHTPAYRRGSSRDTTNATGNNGSSNDDQEYDVGEAVLGILFEKLEMDFYMPHENAGNGIEVSAGTFVIIGLEDSTKEEDEVFSAHSVTLEDVSMEQLIFAPRKFPLLNIIATSPAFKSADKKGHKNTHRAYKDSVDAPQVPPVGAAPEVAAASTKPHISYSQQGTGNLRRCIVNISDSVAVANIAKILHAVEYFLKPIHVNTHRSLYAIETSGRGPYDFKIALDMEVHVNNTVVCLTNIERKDVSPAFSSQPNLNAHGGSQYNPRESALCFAVNLDYTQAWRGFLSSGPGKIGLGIDIGVKHVYIAPMREVNTTRIQSVVDSCVLIVGQDMRIHAPESSLATNLALLKNSGLKLKKVTRKPSKADKPTTSRVVRFKVAPMSDGRQEDRLGIVEELQGRSESSKRRKAARRARAKRADGGSEPSSPGPPEDYTSSDSSDDDQQQGREDDSDDEEGDNDENEQDNSNDEVEDDGRDRTSSRRRAHSTVNPGETEAGSAGVHSNEAIYGADASPSARSTTVRVQVSLKDIIFINAAVRQCRQSLHKRIAISSLERDFFYASKLTVQDIAHLPQLTHYLVNTPLQIPAKGIKNNELLADICDFEAVLRNNTYNLKILRFNVFNNCMLYNRTPEQLHMAAGSACSMWVYNEVTDLWEPLIEPINIRAIGATDESLQAAVLSTVNVATNGLLGGGPTVASESTSTGAASPGPIGGITSSGAKVRVEVVTDPLELNAPQTAMGQLIRKLTLADVVTTSSIHLPPYKIINELGIDMKFSIAIEEDVITENQIEAGKHLPVEVQQLAEALDTYRYRKNFSSATTDLTSNKEYVMGINFANYRDIYQSKAALPIDKVGIHVFEMIPTGVKTQEFSALGMAMSGFSSVASAAAMAASTGVNAAKAGINVVTNVADTAVEHVSGVPLSSVMANTAAAATATVSTAATTVVSAAASVAVQSASAAVHSATTVASVAASVATSAMTQPVDFIASSAGLTPPRLNGRSESTAADFTDDDSTNVSTMRTAASTELAAELLHSDVPSDAQSPTRGKKERPLPPPPAPPVTASPAVNAASSSGGFSLLRRQSVSMPDAPMKFQQEIPLAIMDMRIKADGVREVLLRSILSLKNNTNRVMHMSVRLYGSSVVTVLPPGKEWFVPVRFVNPKASLFIRHDEQSNWFEALSSLQSLILQGYWGDPSRLRAHLCACPMEVVSTTTSSSESNHPPGGEDHGWILLMKPEVRDTKGQAQSGNAGTGASGGGAGGAEKGSGTGKSTFVSVRYPTRDMYAKSIKEGMNNALEGGINPNFDSGGPNANVGAALKTGRRIQPLCIQLLAPLQLCNLIPQPLLYRLADADGLITSEGCLLPGEMVDIHTLHRMFISRIFVSVRMLNYCWSKWTLVFSRTNPFSTNEKTTDFTLTSMNFPNLNNPKEPSTLPTVDLSMSMKEYLVRFTCSVLLSNRSGLPLEFCESSAQDSLIPLPSRTGVDAFLPSAVAHYHQKQKHQQQEAITNGDGAPVEAFKPKRRGESDFKERPSFRIVAKSAKGVKIGKRGNSSFRHHVGEEIEGSYDHKQYITGRDGVVEGEEGEGRDSGESSDRESGGLDECGDFESSDDEFADATSKSKRDFRLKDPSFKKKREPAVKNIITDEMESAFDAGYEDDSEDEHDDEGGLLHASSSGSGKHKQQQQHLEMMLSRRLSMQQPPSPMSPMNNGGSSPLPFRSNPGRLNSTSTGGLQNKSIDFTTPASSGTISYANKVTVIVHLPYDHLRFVEVSALEDWTLLDVFTRVKSRLAIASVHQSVYNYVIFQWEGGKYGPRRVDNASIMEAQAQYDQQQSGPGVDTLGGMVLARRGSLLGGLGEEGGGGEDTFDAGGDMPASAAGGGGGGGLSRRDSSAMPAPLPTQRSTFFGGGNRSSVNVSHGSPSKLTRQRSVMDVEIPGPMQFEMLVDSGGGGINGLQPLALTTRLSELLGSGSLSSTSGQPASVLRIRVCHNAEHDIYKQARAIRTEVQEKEGIFSSMFGRPKCTHYATFVPFDGDIPFRPHRMLGFTPSMSVRVSSITDWSDGVDVVKGDFDMSELSICAFKPPPAAPLTAASTAAAIRNRSSTNADTMQKPKAAAPPLFFEFGAMMERGRGFLHNTTTVTIVPKHIFVSKLSFPVELRQLLSSEMVTGGSAMLQNNEPTLLLPGAVSTYHFLLKAKTKLLQVRRANMSKGASDFATLLANADNASLQWFAEIDVCKIGVMHAKLRDPLLIIKVQVDVVGASLVATFSEQNAIWPPYRLDNMTDMDVRVRQITASNQPGGAGGNAGNRDSAKQKLNLDLSIEGLVANKSILPWDTIEKRNSQAYAWDLMFSARKTIQLEILQPTAGWVSTEVNLDEDREKIPPLLVKTAAPSLGNPLAEGYLLRQITVASAAKENANAANSNTQQQGASAASTGNSGSAATTAVAGEWTKVYCILRPDVLYVYPDETRGYLIEVINLSLGDVLPPRGSPEASSRGDSTRSSAPVTPQPQTLPLSVTPAVVASNVQFAEVTRYADKKKTAIRYLTSVIGGGGGNGNGAIDINKARTLILNIADELGLFASLSEQSFLVTSNSSDASGDDNSALDAPVDTSSTNDTTTATAGGEVATSDDNPPQRVTETSAKHRLSVSFGLPPIESLQSDPVLDLLLADQNSNETSTSPAAQLPEDDEEFQATLSRRTRYSSVAGASLPTLLKSGISIDQLLEEAGNIPIRTADVISALVTMKYVEKMDKAKEVCEWMLMEGLLMPRTASHRVDDRLDTDSDDGDGESATESEQEGGAGDDSEEDSGIEDVVANGSGGMDHLEAIQEEDDDDDEEGVEDKVEGVGSVGSPTSAGKKAAGSSTIPFENKKPRKLHKQHSSSSAASSRASSANRKTVSLTRESLQTANHENSTTRTSFSQQLSRAISTTRTSLVASTEEFEAAMLANNRRSMVSIARKKFSLLKMYEDVDLFMCPPALNPEMMAMLKQIEENDALTGGVPQHPPPTSNTLEGSGEVFGFTLAMSNVKYNFKCASEMEFFGWIQACRQCVEICWVDHLLCKRVGKKAVSLEDYQATIHLRLRADGSTKVLEIMQDEENVVTREARQAKRFGRSGPKNRRGTVSSAEAINKLSRVIRESHHAHTLQHPSNNPGAGDLDLDQYKDKELISVLFSVQSVALSIINAEPAELLYISLSGIEMTVERSVDLVKFSVTVSELQFSNQLLNPEFPVTLYPRRIKNNVINHSHGRGGRLMLPGLNPSRTTFPSLHFYIQQRYHQSISDVNQAATESFEADSHLHYFEMFTLWIAPMQLDIEEEIIVKLLRYSKSLRNAVYRPSLSVSRNLGGGSGHGHHSGNHRDEAMVVQQLTGGKTASWEMALVDKRAVLEIYMRLVGAGKTPYLTFNPNAKSTTGIYLSLLQLHPIDVVMQFRPSPNLQVNNSELAIISIISQLDSARLCLNALIAEHAFGSPQIMGEILLKHYKAAFWRQFHKFIGTADFVEGSVGLVANLGSGFYDLFYEPIDGLMDENRSFLSGLSKGGISLASRTIGGTSGFTSQITGGLGKGVSLLTLDSQFQRNRTYRRFNKTTSVSEGIYVGAKELGGNIVEGVTGVVVAPYRGWETGGGVGFGMGIAKGILGVALKPAVGVFDLASRTAEGLRHTAFNPANDAEALLEEMYKFGIHRKRIPRAFGRNGQIALYDAHAAAAQYISDSLTGFQYETRMQVVHHLYMRRKLPPIIKKKKKRSGSSPSKDSEGGSLKLDTSGLGDEDKGNRFEEDEDEILCTNESWGMMLNKSFIVLVSPHRIALAELCNTSQPASSPPTTGISNANNDTKKVVVRSNNKKPLKPRKFIWSCPAQCIEQLFSDPRGDLCLSVSNSTLISGPWNNNQAPVMVDNQAQNYVLFQSLLEQTIGFRRARKHPLYPTADACTLLQSDIRKRYLTGFRSFLMNPTSHTYRLCGHVLYEYTDTSAKKAEMKATEQLAKTFVPLAQRVETESSGGASAENSASVNSSVMSAERSPVAPQENSSGSDRPEAKAELYIDSIINKLFPNSGTGKTAAVDAKRAASIDPDSYCSFIYPLTDLILAGPVAEEVPKGANNAGNAAGNGPTTPAPTCYSITMSRLDGKKMRTLKSDEDQEHFAEYAKTSLSLIFNSLQDANRWKHALEEAILWNLDEDELIPVGPLTAEEKRRQTLRSLIRGNSNAGSSAGGTGESGSTFDHDAFIPPPDDSILGTLVLPTGGCRPDQAESIKIEIAKTLSATRWR